MEDMIAFLRGEVTVIRNDSVVIDVGGIGYDVCMPSSSLKRLGRTGEEVMVYTHLQLREDTAVLYGFMNQEDLEMFRLLIGVSGIGPKGAVAVLSALTSSDLRFAILADDVKSISAAPGIGRKTAQKMILELKDRIDFTEAIQSNSLAGTVSAGSDDARSEAVQALTALGYSGAESLRAVNRIPDEEGLTTEDILKLALKEI